MMAPTADVTARPARLGVLLALVLIPLLPVAAAAQIQDPCGTASGNFKGTRFGSFDFSGPITAADFNRGYIATTVTHHIELQGQGPKKCKEDPTLPGCEGKAWQLCVQYDINTMNLGPYDSGGAKRTEDLLVYSNVSGGFEIVPQPARGYLVVHQQPDGATVDLTVRLRLLLRWEGPTDEPGTYGGTVEWVVSEY